MSYEYKYHIKHDLEHLNEYGNLSGVYKLNQKLKELDEVYKKAEAFDDIAYDYENNTGLGEHDEDLTDFEAIVDSIEYAIQEVESSENEVAAID